MEEKNNAERCACGTHTKAACDFAGVCGQTAPAAAQQAQGVGLTEPEIVGIFNRVQGRWSNFGGPLNAIYKFAREVERAILARHTAPADVIQNGSAEDKALFEAWAQREGLSVTPAPGMECRDGRFPATYFYSSTETAWRAWANKTSHSAEPVAADEVRKSLNAQVADLLRPFLKEGQKVIWREPFRWHDDNGVLSNHYDGFSIEGLAEDFEYEVPYDFNFAHAAIVGPRTTAADNQKGGAS